MRKIIGSSPFAKTLGNLVRCNRIRSTNRQDPRKNNALHRY